MNASDQVVLVLAQGIAGDNATPATGGGDPAGTQGGGGSTPSLFGGSFLWIIMALMVFMIFSSVMSGRKEKKKKAAMMANLAKNAKVQTVGGIIGTVVELKNDEVVLKVDESGHTRIRFARSAVQQVLKQGKDDGEGAAEIEEISID